MVLRRHGAVLSSARQPDPSPDGRFSVNESSRFNNMKGRVSSCRGDSSWLVVQTRRGNAHQHRRCVVVPLSIPQEATATGIKRLSRTRLLRHAQASRSACVKAPCFECAEFGRGQLLANGVQERYVPRVSGLPVHVPRYGTTGLCTRLSLVNKTTNRGWGGKGLLKGLALYVTSRPFQRASAHAPVTGPEHPIHHPPSHYRPEALLLPSMSLPADDSGAGEDHSASLQGSTTYSSCTRDMAWSLLHGGPGRSSGTVMIERGSSISANRLSMSIDIGYSPVPVSRGLHGVSSDNRRCIQYPQ